MTKTKAAPAAPAQATLEVSAAPAPTSPTAIGVDLRDQLAMHAPPMPAWWTNGYMARTGHNVIDAAALATWSYEFADAALKAREQ